MAYIDNEHMSHSLGLDSQFTLSCYQPDRHTSDSQLGHQNGCEVKRLTVVLTNAGCGGNVILDWLLACLHLGLGRTLK